MTAAVIRLMLLSLLPRGGINCPATHLSRRLHFSEW
ncbi:hypothetical protein LEMLEM_LOCUS12292, partial [Lemmus lemmus]